MRVHVYVFQGKELLSHQLYYRPQKAMKVLISSTQRSGPSGQSNLLLKPFPPEIPWKQGDSVTKVMRYDIIYKGSTSVQFSVMSNQMKERVVFFQCCDVNIFSPVRLFL